MAENKELKLPVYNVALGDYDEGMFAISLVKNPAIESNFVYMSKDEELKTEEVSFLFSDEEKGEAIGALLVPDKPILRVMDGQAFYVVFSKAVIEQLNERMHKYGYEGNFTIAHEMRTGAVTMLESWIKESEEDKSNSFGFSEPIGTLFMKVKIDSEFIKDNIKNGNLNGFSAEMDVSIVKDIITKNEKEMKFEEMYKNSIDVDGKKLLFNGEIEKGTVLFELETVENKENIKPFSGEFKLENVKYTVNDGLVSNVEDVELTLSQKIDTLTGDIKAVKTQLEAMRAPKEGEERDELVDSVATILTKLEEQSLLAKQKELDAEKQKLEKESSNFSVEAYEAASKWAQRFE